MSKYITIQNEEVGIRSFEIMSDAAPNVDLGGFINERTITTAGRAVTGRTRKLWQIDGVDVFCDKDAGDLEFLETVNESKKKDNIITYEHNDGDVYSGTGGISGDLKYNAQTQVVSLTFTGGGKLKRIDEK
jgi:hypothetical protein